MARGRITKFTPDRIAKILEGLKSGMTKRASAAYGGVSEDTLINWLSQPSKSHFSAQVAEAENIAESRYTSVIAKAAFGHPVTIERTTTKQVPYKVKKIIYGQPVETTEFRTVQETTIETKTEYDWRAALEWMKRRRREEWGDKIDINVDHEIEKTLLALQRVTTEEQAESEDAPETLH